MSKITNALGLFLIVGMIAVGCDSVVDGDSATQESLIQSEFTGENSVMHGSAITSPKSGEVVYENTLQLMVEDHSDNTVAWAVRPFTESCDNYNETLSGNVNVDDPSDYEWDGEKFSAEVDIENWDAGKYCFAFNTQDTGDASGSRLTQSFYIVDEYAKVGGVVDANGETKGNGTHAMEGVVGFAGSEGPVGEIVVNYRGLDEYCTFTPTGDLSIGDTATGIGENEPVRADGTFKNSCSSGTAGVWILGRGGSNSTYSERGAIAILNAGDYIIDINPDILAPEENWVPMLKGNNIVGTRLKNQ